MQFSIISQLQSADCDAVVVLTRANTQQQQLEHYGITDVATWLQLSDFDSSFNDAHALFAKSEQFSALYVVGLGDSAELNPSKLAKLAATIIKPLQKKYSRVAIDYSAVPEPLQVVMVLALAHADYSYDEFKSKKTERTLQQVMLVGSHLTPAQLQLISAIDSGQQLTRTLGNMPANFCYPESMAAQAEQLAAEFPELLKVTILTEDDMRQIGMNAFLAVSQGSARPGRLVLLEYQNNAEHKPIVLVGKGVTFDTGGISIKPAAGMDEMKFDMCGAAAVMGVMRALCISKLPLNVVGAMAYAENMPSGKATRPGDVVTTLSGQTVEILNTDAEGRLVLCDTLSYIARYQPEIVIDMATLTGACVVALGKIVSGLFSNNDQLALELQQAGEQSWDRVWRMPLLEDYQELLDSTVADMGNIGGPTAGAITAACFLARFCKDYHWAHLDIAGTAWLSGTQKGATGRPVALIMQYLANRVAAAGLS